MKIEFKDLIAATIVVVFSAAILLNPHDKTYAETLKNVMVMSVGYYLGASRVGNYLAMKNADLIGSSTTSSSPQPVTVVNDESAPVPTTEASK